MVREVTDIRKMIDESVKIAEITQTQLGFRLDQIGSDDERRRLVETDPKARALKKASQAAQLVATHLGKLLED